MNGGFSAMNNCLKPDIINAEFILMQMVFTIQNRRTGVLEITPLAAHSLWPGCAATGGIVFHLFLSIFKSYQLSILPH